MKWRGWTGEGVSQALSWGVLGVELPRLLPRPNPPSGPVFLATP